MELIKPITRFLKKQKDEIGTSPDQLIFRGVPKSDKVDLRLIQYGNNACQEVEIHQLNEVQSYLDKEAIVWLNVDGLHDTELMENISKDFNFPLIMLADVMNTGARPTVTEYETGLYISIKMLRLDPDSDIIHAENLSLLLNKSLLITFQEIKGDVFEPIRERIRKFKKRISSSGTDYLAFTILDVIIDNYIFILGTLGEKIERLEEELMSDPESDVIDKIYMYKRELNYLRRNIKPTKEMINDLIKEEIELIKETSEIHFYELQNNIDHANEIADSYRDVLSDQLNIYHTTMTSKLNDIMKFLTVFSVVFIPLTFIAGIYGTNFDFIPELRFKYSYFIMLGIMLMIGSGMMIYFKRNKWL